MKKTAFFTLCVLALSLFSCGDMLSDDFKGSADSEEVYIVIDGLDDSNEAIVGTWLYVRLSNNEDAEWSTSNADIASLSYYDYPFDSYNKYMTATVILRSEGSVKITAKTSAGEYHRTLDVLDRIIVSKNYEESYDYDAVEVGDELWLRMASDGWAKWSVSDESKASLSTTLGYSTSLTAKSTGSVTVSAKTSLSEYSCTIQITFSKNVQFKNPTEYKVTVRRDGQDGEIVAEILPKYKWTGYVAPSNEETVFYFNYSAKVIIEDPDYGTVWGDMEYVYTHPVDSSDLEKKVTPIDVPLPENSDFTATYLKIYNGSIFPFSLYRTNTQIKTIRGTLNVQPQTWGIYKVTPSGGKLFTDLALKTPDNNNSISIEEFPAQNGIYECTLYDYNTQSLKPVLQN